MNAVNRRIVLASRPHGEPKPENFRLEEVPVPEIGPGQILLRTRWLSLDPYMRGRMSDAKSYATPVQIGDPITAEVVGEVVASKNPDIRSGNCGRPSRAGRNISPPTARAPAGSIRRPPRPRPRSACSGCRA